MASNSNEHQLVVPRHIQDHTNASSEIYYWGYATRVFPCTNDKGSCEYLDAVYWMHTVSMLYTFIMWAVIGGILLFFVLGRLFGPHRKNSRHPKQSYLYRSYRSVSTAGRRYLLPESYPKLFPNTTRLQVLILAIIVVYLTVFS
jgi:hypothetical protein